MMNANDAAGDLIEGLEEAANKTASLKTATGLHHFSLAVYASKLPDLDTNAADASQRISRLGGAVPIREQTLWYNGAQEAAYYSQLPGTFPRWTSPRWRASTTSRKALAPGTGAPRRCVSRATA